MKYDAITCISLLAYFLGEGVLIPNHVQEGHLIKGGCLFEGGTYLTLSLRVIKVKFPLQPHQKYYITQ